MTLLNRRKPGLAVLAKTLETCGDVGVGRIVARKKRVSVGADEEIVVLELAQGLTVTLPVERAHRQLRPPVDELDMVGCNKRCGRTGRRAVTSG